MTGTHDGATNPTPTPTPPQYPTPTPVREEPDNRAADTLAWPNGWH